MIDPKDPNLKIYQDPNSWPTRFRGALDGAVEDCVWFAHLANEMQLEQRWMSLAPTWEEFCQKKMGHPAEFVEAVIAGVRALGEDVPVPIEKAVKVGRDERAKNSKQLYEQGVPVAEIAKRHNCHRDTVYEDLKLSEKTVVTENSDIKRKPVLQINSATNPEKAAALLAQLHPDWVMVRKTSP